MFYYLSGWEMRHLHTGGSQLPGSLWAGVCDYDQFWSLAGRVAQSAEAMPNFSFCYVTSRKNQLFCAKSTFVQGLRHSLALTLYIPSVS